MLKTRIQRYLILVTISGLFSFEAKSADINILTESFPSELERLGENEMGGVAGEVLTAALRQNHISFKIIWTRWKTAQQQTIENKDKKNFIAPLTRNAKRENLFNWVAKVYEINTVFFTKKGNKKINSFAEMKGKKNGVLLGSSYEQKVINEKGEANKNEVSSVPYDKINIEKLLSGEIYAWYDSVVGGNAYIKSEKIDSNQIEYGNKIDVEDNYIASTNATSPELIKEVKDAIESFRKTKKYNEILNKYGMK